MEITKDELERFANAVDNAINPKQCDSNALKVYYRYKGEIYYGTASYCSKKNIPTRTVNGHFWNVISNQETGSKQVIDIYNYKRDGEGIYSEYIGCVIPVEDLKKLMIPI